MQLLTALGVEASKVPPALWENPAYVGIVVISVLTGASVRLYDRWKKGSEHDEERLDGQVEARISELKERIEKLESTNETLTRENRKLTIYALKKEKS